MKKLNRTVIIGMRNVILLLIASSVCWSRADDKIVGGSPVKDIRSVPYYATLQHTEWLIWTSSSCGATIFTALYVITACHCVVDHKTVNGKDVLLLRHPLDKFRVRAGSARLDGDEDHVQDGKRLASIEHHPNCKVPPRIVANDVALLKLETPFDVNGYVKPVSIYSLYRDKFEFDLNLLVFTSPNFPEPPCVVAGIGSTRRVSLQEALKSVTAGPASLDPQLKSVGMYPMFEGKCLYKFWKAVRELTPQEELDPIAFTKKHGVVLHKKICALSKSEVEGSCQGDSGSGLVCNGYLVGITSSGVGCANKAPDFFQSLLHVLDFIRNKTCVIHSCEDAQHLHPECFPRKKEAIIDLYCKKQDSRPKSCAPQMISSLCLIIIILESIRNTIT